MPKQKQPTLEAAATTELSRGILAIIYLVSAAIITLSFFGSAGAFGTMLNEYVLSTLFGGMRFATPFVFLVLAYFVIRDLDYNYRATHAIGGLIFFISTCSMLHMHITTDLMWSEALLGNGGGIVGMFAWVMQNYLGSIAGFIILAALLLISLLLLFNTLLTHLILLHHKFFEGLGLVGAQFISIIRKLFERPRTYDSSWMDDENNDEEENLHQKRSFFARRINDMEEKEDEEDEELEENDESEEDEESTTESGSLDPETTGVQYLQNVIIKNLPPMSFLSENKTKPSIGDAKASQQTIKDTFSDFRIEVDMGEVRVGPTVTQFTFKPQKGVKLTRITSLNNNIALALAAHPIRIEAPIPGTSLVGIEVPNLKAAQVTMKELLESKEFKTRPHNMMAVLGKDVSGKVWVADLPRMPHLLVAGTTGSGKTVCINTLIMGLLYQNTAETLRFIMVDPKRVELTMYNGIPHLLTPVITNAHQTVNALKWAIGEMDRRFELLSQVGNRDITAYNSAHPNQKLPHIVFIIDELADLMQSAGNDVEAGIIRLAQMARAIGIHLIVATQRPSVDVITGLMKANIPARIAFSVASITDSRTILDEPGAEKLLGRGDMLLSTSELGKPVRIQGAYISEKEVKSVIEYLQGDEEPQYDTSIVEKPTNIKGGTANMFGGPPDDQDPMFEEAKRVVVESGKASASLLQRRLRLGYARAARVLDELEEAGIIGPSDGAKARTILIKKGDLEDTSMKSGGHLNVFDSPKELTKKQFNIREEIEEEDDEVEEENDDNTSEEEIEEETDILAQVEVEEDDSEEEEDDNSVPDDIENEKPHFRY